LRELDKEYKLTDDSYSIEDFIEDLKKKGYIKDEVREDGSGGLGITKLKQNERYDKLLLTKFWKLETIRKW
jgi:hypothetical protein